MPLMKRKKTCSSLPSLEQILRRTHIIVVWVTVATTGIFLSLATGLALRFHAHHNLELIAHSVSHMAEMVVVSNVKTAASSLVKLMKSHDEIGEMKVLNLHGGLLTSLAHPAGHLLRNPREFVKWAFSYTVKVPVIHNGNKVGEIWLTGYEGHFVRFFWIGIPGMIACLVFSILLALFLTRHLLRGIVGPLNSVTQVAHSVSKNRVFGLRVPSAPIAELDVLSRDFNGLLHQLEIWQTSLTEENDRLAYCATHDSLTGLANRAFFEGRLSRIISECLPSEQVAILYLDCDHFKQFNDDYGHASGDIILVTVASRMQAQLRKSDLVARLGGDEFAVLLAPIHDPKDALHIADNILACMKQPIILSDGNSIVISLSMGIAFYPEHTDTPETLLAKADQAMYKAKNRRSGGCRVTAENP